MVQGQIQVFSEDALTHTNYSYSPPEGFTEKIVL